MTQNIIWGLHHNGYFRLTLGEGALNFFSTFAALSHLIHLMF